MSKTWNVVLLAAASGLMAAGCAHQAPVAKVEPPPAMVDPAPVKLTQRSEPTPATPADDGSAELARVLQGGAIHFDFDSAQLEPRSLDVLKQVGSVLKRHANLKLSIEGNCDERGTAEYNLALGERRAGAARKYLIDLGVPPTQVDDVSYGAERPLDPRHTEDAWAVNRRDDLKPAN